MNIQATEDIARVNGVVVVPEDTYEAMQKELQYYKEHTDIDVDKQVSKAEKAQSFDVYCKMRHLDKTSVSKYLAFSKEFKHNLRFVNNTLRLRTRTQLDPNQYEIKQIGGFKLTTSTIDASNVLFLTRKDSDIEIVADYYDVSIGLNKDSKLFPLFEEVIDRGIKEGKIFEGNYNTVKFKTPEAQFMFEFNNLNNKTK